MTDTTFLAQWKKDAAALQEKVAGRHVDKDLPRLKPAPGEITVECPQCHQHVSETCCAYQDFDYYKDCYCYITRHDAKR